MAKKDEKYEEIVTKLGFIPSELKNDCKPEEDDSRINPFSVLDPDEVWYLLNNGYLNKQNTTA